MSLRHRPPLVLVLLLGAPLVAVASPSYGDEPVTITTHRRADLPVSVPTETQNQDAYPRRLGFDLTGPPGTEVTVTFGFRDAAPGPPSSVTIPADGTLNLGVDLTDPTPGLRSYTATASSHDGPTVSATYDSLFTPGGAGFAVTGGDSLEGRAFSYLGGELEGESTYVSHEHLVWFLADGWAHLGPVGGGRPACTHVSRECKRYRYDASTGLAQVGPAIIAKVDATTSYFVGASEEEGYDFTDYEPGYADFQPLREPAVGMRSGGRWTFDGGYSVHGLTDIRLRLTRGGLVDLRYEIYDEDTYRTTHRRLEGRYRVLRDGRARIVYPGGAARHHRRMTKDITLLRSGPALWVGITTGRGGEDGHLLTPA